MPNKEWLRCQICGETAPEPAWMCLYRITGAAKPGEPCSYSVEGDARMREWQRALAEEVMVEVEEVRRARASGIPVTSSGDTP